MLTCFQVIRHEEGALNRFLLICLVTLAAFAPAGEPKPPTEQGEETIPVLIEMIRIKDHLTGEIRKPSADELRLILPQNPLARSHEGLVSGVTKNGDVRMDLQGRFQCAVMAKIGPDGKVVTACVNSDHKARTFLARKVTEVNHDR